MKKHDKTKTYSDSNKTSIYGDSEKLTKGTVHNLKAGDHIVLNNAEYTIIEIISESTGEAVIYKIEDAEQNIFALKLYYEFNSAENEPNTEALLRIKNIKDVDILRLYDFGTGINKYENKYCFEILDFAHGLDLLDVNNLKETYKPDFIIKEVIPQIFKGILKLHENRIYHCDLKPQNVFYLDKEQIEIVIGDYGSAKTFEFDAEKKSRKTTTVKGTDFYLPPEQARGFISEKNDYYSFGMILLHLFYPEKILLNESNPKSLSRSKLKQIIERQFEAKPIIDYNPKYKKINSLIEGLTLVDFNLRWGKEQVEQWIKGEKNEVIYRKPAQTQSGISTLVKKTLKFGKYTINTPYDLRNYILNDKNWYEDLIEDKDNREDLMNWMLNLYNDDKSKRSELNRIIKNYSQEGTEIVADAIIRFFIPNHPVIFGQQLFEFTESENLKKTTAQAFIHLIFDLWDSSSDKDIQLYLFRYEFAVKQTRNNADSHRALKILYKKLSLNENAESDFKDYMVYAYTKTKKNSLNLIREFLTDYLVSNIEIEVISWDKENNLDYNIIKSTSDYFQSIGIDHMLSHKSVKQQVIQLRCPDSSDSFDDFIENIFNNFMEDISFKHNIFNDISLASTIKIKETIKSTFRNIYKHIENEFSNIKEEFSEEIKTIRGFNTDFNDIINFFQDVKYDKIVQISEDIHILKSELIKVVEAKEILSQCNNTANKTSLAIPLFIKAKNLIKTNNYKKIEEALQILTKKHSFKFETFFDLRNIKRHKQISYKRLNRLKRIKAYRKPIDAFAVFPGESYIAAVTSECFLVIYNLYLKRAVYISKIKQSIDNFLSVSKSGKEIALISSLSASEYKRPLIFDTYSGKRIRSLSNFFLETTSAFLASCAVFSPDSKYLAVSYNNGKTFIWNIERKKIVKKIITSKSICYHPRENILATQILNKGIKLIDLNTGKSSIIPDEHSDSSGKLCFSPDGKLIANSCKDDNIRIWDVKSAELLHVISGENPHFSPDGEFLVSVPCTQSVRFWSIATGEPVLTLTKFIYFVDFAFHPSGDYIVVATEEQILLIFLKNTYLDTVSMNLIDFITFENKQSEEKRKIKSESLDDKKYEEAEKFYWKGFAEEKKQRSKRFSGSFNEAILLYSKAADLGHKLAKQKLNDFNK